MLLFKDQISSFTICRHFLQMKLGSTLNVALIAAIALLLEGRSVEAFGGSSVYLSHPALTDTNAASECACRGPAPYVRNSVGTIFF